MIDNSLVWALSALSITLIVVMVYISIAFALLAGIFYGIAQVFAAAVRGIRFRYGKI